MSLVLGIDPGSRITGYGLIETGAGAGARHTYVASGCIRLSRDAPLPNRLGEIFTALGRIIEQYQPVEFAIERIFMSRNADSALKLGEARGVAIVAGVNAGLPIFEYEARKVKQAVVGTGAATKAQMQHMVKTLLALPGTPQEDAADALGIALCHIHTRGGLPGIAAASGRFRRGRLRG
jgi:crossover junction endodeoxyribonuclease RuvC